MGVFKRPQFPFPGRRWRNGHNGPPPAGTVCQPAGSPFGGQSAVNAAATAATGVVLPPAVRQAPHAY